MAIAVRAQDALVALTRFGLGARPGERAKIATDARGFVEAQLHKSAPTNLGGGLLDTPTILAADAAYMVGIRERADETSDANSMAAIPAPASTLADIYAREITARTRHAIRTDAGFVERWVMFWSNFFTVGADKSGIVRSLAGAFEREAIRPHALGRFADLLRAATEHPAMLVYLDNQQSIGPLSRRGARRHLGLNENLARETLELHSLGVDGGYDQSDVTTLAKAITGWRYAGERDPVPFGTFYFDAASHEPGALTILGKTYPPGGVGQGEAVLADLALHPATAHFVATRLAAHFVASPPPPDLVARLEKRFVDTGGDLRKVAEALVGADAAWTAPPVKFLPPYDFVVAAYRLTGMALRIANVVHVTDVLGQATWVAPSPKGWPEDDTIWASPDGLLQRVDWASIAAAGVAGSTDVAALADDVLGARLAAPTREAIAHAESRAQALALLITSSEFQTR